MIEYLIIAISFAIVVHISYMLEALATIRDVITLLCLEEEPSSWNPVIFSIIFFIFSIVTMPIMAIVVAIEGKQKFVELISTSVLKGYFNLTEK